MAEFCSITLIIDFVLSERKLADIELPVVPSRERPVLISKDQVDQYT